MRRGTRDEPASRPRRPRLELALVAVVAAALAPATSSAGGDASKKYREQAIAHYAEGDYRAAADAFASAYRMGGEPALLFAWAQAERKAHDCDRATRLYRDFLGTSPPDTDVDAARQGIALCEAELSALRTDDPWYADIRAGVSTGTGAVLLGVGVGYYFATRSAVADVAAAANDAQREQQVNAARGHATISFISTATGAALLTYGVLRYLALRRDQRARAEARLGSDTQVAPAVGPDTAGVVLFGRF